ncbi:bifunctional 3-deoxy-7-phosphoheptulonate synthase/chorismate mutase [bacterium]|nr:bifunctional 3-deoxy-7-phosphoheptulonate synthase/chorismate mutase [bacterium]
MIIQLKHEISRDLIDQINSRLGVFGFKSTEVQTQSARYLVAIGNVEIDIRQIGCMSGVKDVHHVSDVYKLVSRKWKAAPTSIQIADDVSIKEGAFNIIAGPCAFESAEQIQSIVTFLSARGVKLLRGGAFKPRTSPYAFRGLGIEGLKLAHSIAHKHQMLVVSEVMEISQIGEMHDYIDVYQVGARNTQNFSLLHELGKVDKPILLKRGMSGTIEELLQSAEYIFASGNEKIILCERGIRTFEDAYRNTLDLNAVPLLKEKSHLPVVVDPSHGIGIRRYVSDLALAAIMAGADGVIFETHATPEKALSDGAQTLNFLEADRLITQLQETFAFRKCLKAVL